MVPRDLSPTVTTTPDIFVQFVGTTSVTEVDALQAKSNRIARSPTAAVAGMVIVVLPELEALAINVHVILFATGHRYVLKARLAVRTAQEFGDSADLAGKIIDGLASGL